MSARRSKTRRHSPPNLVGDEKHTWRLGQRVYVATTAAQGCLLGAALAESADAQSLTEAYGEFAQEARELAPDYQPETVNLDGWEPTHIAWLTLFPGITLVLCFLHTVLAIQRLCRRHSQLYETVTDRLWRLYRSVNRRQFAQRLRRLREWAQGTITSEPLRQKILNLKTKTAQFTVAFDFPKAYRTSNQVDRLMNYQDRLLYDMLYFHGTHDSANQALRAMAVIWNFHPYCRKIQTLPPYSQSPFEDLNGFRYHDNWLHNLLIASSINGRRFPRNQKHKLVPN